MKNHIFIRAKLIILILVFGIIDSPILISDDSSKFDSIIALSALYIEANPELSIKYANDAKKYITEDIDNYVIQEVIGVSNMFAGDDSLGIDIFNELLIYYTDNDKIFYLTILYADYGYYFFSHKNYEMALDYFIKAKEFAIREENNILLCSIYRNIGNVNNALGNDKDKLKAYLTLQELAEEVKEEIHKTYYIVYSLYTRAMHYSDNENYIKADSILKLAYAKLCKSPDIKTKRYQSLKTSIFHHKGLILSNQAKYDSAYSYFKRAYSPDDDNTNKIVVLGNIGNLFIRWNKIDSAMHYLKLAEEIDSANHYTPNVYKLFGKAYISNKDTINAKIYFKKAYNIFLKDKKYSNLIETIILTHSIENNIDIKNELIQELSDFQDVYNAERIRLVTKNTKSELNIIHSNKRLRAKAKYQNNKFILMMIFSILLLILLLIIIVENKKKKETNGKLNVSNKEIKSKSLQLELSKKELENQNNRLINKTNELNIAKKMLEEFNNTLQEKIDIQVLELEVSNKELQILDSAQSDLLDKMDIKKKELLNQTMVLVDKNNFLLKLKEQISEIENDSVISIVSINSEIDEEIRNEKYWDIFDKQFMELDINFSKELFEIHSDLTLSEYRICQLIKLNLSNKEISNSLSLSLRTIEKHRTNIRKKMNLHREDSLFTVLNNL